MTKRDPNELMTPSEAARVLGLSADSVRALSDGGRLPTLKTVSGRRLFRRGDVENLAAERARVKSNAGARRRPGGEEKVIHHRAVRPISEPPKKGGRPRRR
jgi:excisionase family DNA binding protein